MSKEQEIVARLTDMLRGADVEKHQRYNILPERIETMIKDEMLKSKPVFFEKERMAFIKSKISFDNKSVLDIGCNVGYFLFGALDDNAKCVTGYEGSVFCQKFVENAIMLLNENKRFILNKKYYDFSPLPEMYDIIILQNVLHHIGDDYGDKSMTISTAKIKIVEQINSLVGNTSILIYQMGFNWQGDIKKCLFENGTKQEMIDYLKEGVGDKWNIVSIGIPERNNNRILYKDVNDVNILRDDSLGEFLNRPLFILKPKENKYHA